MNPYSGKSRRGNTTPNSTPRNAPTGIRVTVPNGPSVRRVSINPRGRSISAQRGSPSRSASRDSRIPPVLLRVINQEGKRELIAYITGAVYAVLMATEVITPRVIKSSVSNAVNAWYQN